MVAKKTAAKKVAKKPIATQPVKKTSQKKSTVSKKSSDMKSFHIYKESPKKFKTFKITRQTIYWAILLAFVIVTQLWLLKIQMDIADLTNTLLEQQ